MPKKFAAELEGFNPFVDLIGLVFTRCENGFSRCVLDINEQLLNPHRTLHGGVAYAMADTGMGGALGRK
jgi:acyl-coenzyme A thioesterase PaaI-like protein